MTKFRRTAPSYDGLAEFSEEHKPRVAQLLVTLSVVTKRFVKAATCKSSSHTTTSWAACTANGCPIWTA